MYLNANGDGRDLWLLSSAALILADVDEGEDKDEDRGDASNHPPNDRTDLNIIFLRCRRRIVVGAPAVRSGVVVFGALRLAASPVRETRFDQCAGAVGAFRVKSEGRNAAWWLSCVRRFCDVIRHHDGCTVTVVVYGKLELPKHTGKCACDSLPIRRSEALRCERRQSRRRSSGERHRPTVLDCQRALDRGSADGLALASRGANSEADIETVLDRILNVVLPRGERLLLARGTGADFLGELARL
mmetsp:Transcript_28876/g.90309  ORF Transcript_28876/g.90309 Transcript_28876/m.90309 type:complete len:244 (-) Transcript_28876:529-1260(-)